MVTLLLKVGILTINGEELGRFPLNTNLTKWLSKCEGSLHKGKNEKQDMVRMRCICGIENGHKVNINGGHGLPNDAPYS